jgi:hypothetical protein
MRLEQFGFKNFEPPMNTDEHECIWMNIDGSFNETGAIHLRKCTERRDRSIYKLSLH